MKKKKNKNIKKLPNPIATHDISLDIKLFSLKKNGKVHFLISIFLNHDKYQGKVNANIKELINTLTKEGLL